MVECCEEAVSCGMTRRLVGKPLTPVAASSITNLEDRLKGNMDGSKVSRANTTIVQQLLESTMLPSQPG